MRILPILFNTDMVRALLKERKTVTRRVIKGADAGWEFRGLDRDPAVFHVRADGEACPKEVKGLYATFEADPGVWFPMFRAPYEVGDILYVRETWTKLLGSYIYKANQRPGMKNQGKWLPSIHMPKDAARIFLLVKDVRAERLKDITEEQARAEGFGSRTEFLKAFLAMYPDCTEESWVWVIEFERVEKPEEVQDGQL